MKIHAPAMFPRVRGCPHYQVAVRDVTEAGERAHQAHGVNFTAG